MYGRRKPKMKHLKIDFAFFTIITLIACYVDKWFSILEIELKTWKAIIIVCFALFVITAILEKVQIIINNHKDKSQD